MLQIASELRDLPDLDFKAQLKKELSAMAKPASVSQRPARNKASYIPAGYHTANACLVVRDAPRAIEFYKAAFGATELTRLNDPSGNLMHAQLKIGDSPIDIAPEQGDYNRSPQSLGGSAVPIELYVEEVDALAERAMAVGAKVIFPVADQFYGDRSGRRQDPFGHTWIVSTHKEDLSSEEISQRAEAWVSERRTAAPLEKPPTPAARAPEGYHSITPYLQVNGAQRLIEFLKQAFAAEEIFRVPRGDQIAHAQLKIEDSMIEVADAIDKYQPNPTAIWLFVKDSDAGYERALKAGAMSLREPTDQDYGDREASVKDPFGNHWYIATHRTDAEPLPEGMHSITPYLHPKGVPQVIDFLRRAFGAEVIFRAQDPEGIVHHAKLASAIRSSQWARRTDHTNRCHPRFTFTFPILMRPTNERLRLAQSLSMSRSIRITAIATRGQRIRSATCGTSRPTCATLRYQPSRQESRQPQKPNHIASQAPSCRSCTSTM